MQVLIILISGSCLIYIWFLHGYFRGPLRFLLGLYPGPKNSTIRFIHGTGLCSVHTRYVSGSSKFYHQVPTWFLSGSFKVSIQVLKKLLSDFYLVSIWFLHVSYRGTKVSTRFVSMSSKIYLNPTWFLSEKKAMIAKKNFFALRGSAAFRFLKSLKYSQIFIVKLEAHDRSHLHTATQKTERNQLSRMKKACMKLRFLHNFLCFSLG